MLVFIEKSNLILLAMLIWGCNYNLIHGVYLFEGSQLQECRRHITCGNNTAILDGELLVPLSERNIQLGEKVYLNPPLTELDYDIGDLLQQIRSHSIIYFVPHTKKCPDSLFDIPDEMPNRPSFHVCGVQEPKTKWIFMNVAPNTSKYEEWSKLCDIDIGCFWGVSYEEIKTSCVGAEEAICLWTATSIGQNSVCYMSPKTADLLFSPKYIKVPRQGNLILGLSIVATIFFLTCAIFLVILVRRQRSASLM